MSNTKTSRWELDARYTYVVSVNELDVVPGFCNARNALEGGWNRLDEVQP